MRRPRALLSLLLLLLLSLSLAGCDTMEDWFSTKKPLPGERRAVFPEGVPGVPQGVPPELVKGYQPPPEPEPAPVAEQVPEKPKPRPKPKPKRVAGPARPSSGGVSIQPAGQSSGPAPAQASPFPPPPAPSSQQPANSPFPPPPAPSR